MKSTKKTLLLAVCASTLAFAGSAFAADASTFTVLGTVTGTCKFMSPTYNMIFGALDPSSTSDATKVSAISYQCTNGTPATSVQINGAASPTTVSLGNATSTATLPVHLTWTTPATAGSGFGPTVAPISFNVTGVITAADLNTATAGFYLTHATISLLP